MRHALTPCAMPHATRFAKQAFLLAAAAFVLLAAAPDGWAKPKKHDGPKTEDEHSVIRADMLAWLLANNPGLDRNFLRTTPPDTTIRLPDGRTVPIYRLKQFLDVNFRLSFFARIQEKGSDVVPASAEHLRKLLALPEFYHLVTHYKLEYTIAGKGKVSAEAAYRYIRGINRRIGVTAHKECKAPVGGGGGINAPSWAVWKAMNIFWHETCHCIGIGHDSGGLSGPIAGNLRKWDRQKKWNYETLDLNAMPIPK